jgi:hypothetical protein
LHCFNLKNKQIDAKILVIKWMRDISVKNKGDGGIMVKDDGSEEG